MIEKLLSLLPRRPAAPSQRVAFKLGRLPDHPLRRNASLAKQAGLTALDLSLIRPTRRYADGRQKFSLTHLGRPTRLAPQPSAKVIQRRERHAQAVKLGLSQADAWTHGERHAAG